MRSLCAARLAPKDQGTRGRHGRIERGEGEKGLRWLEPDAPAAVADDPSEPSAQGSPALRTAGASDERVDPGLAGFRQVGPFRFIEEAAQIRGRGEIPQPENGYESTAAARQRQPHGQRTRTESE